MPKDRRRYGILDNMIRLANATYCLAEMQLTPAYRLPFVEGVDFQRDQNVDEFGRAWSAKLVLCEHPAD